MKRIAILGAAVALGGAAAPVPPPGAHYWMDVTTTSGFGAGMAGGGGRPSMGQIMGMMSGGSSVGHMLDLRLASRQKPAGAGEADHWIPAGLQMGASLPLVAPVRQEEPRS